MGNHETELRATPEQCWDITSLLGRAVLASRLTQAQAQAIQRNKKASEKTVVEVLRSLGIEFSAKHPAAALLEQYFKEVYAHAIDLSGVDFTEKDGFTTWMANPPELNEDQIMERLTAYFKVNSYRWMNPLVATIDRAKAQKRPSGLYVFAHRGTDEPDDMHRNKSYDRAMAEGFPFANPKEYLLMTGFHRYVNGYFMDKKGWTRTSSLGSGGSVVCGCWSGSGGKLGLDGGGRDGADPVSGPRELFLGDLSL